MARFRVLLLVGGGVPSRWTARGPLKSRCLSPKWRINRFAPLLARAVSQIRSREVARGVHGPRDYFVGRRVEQSSSTCRLLESGSGNRIFQVCFPTGVITSTVHRRDAVQRLRVRQGRDDLALRGGRDARSGGELNPRPPAPAPTGGSPKIFTTLVAFRTHPLTHPSPAPEPGPRAGAGTRARGRGCRRYQGKSERECRLETPPVPRPTAPAPSSGPAGDETAHLLRPKIRQAPSLTSPPHPSFRRSRRLPSIPGSPRRTRRSTATPATTSSTSAFTARHDHSPERNPPNRAARLCVSL